MGRAHVCKSCEVPVESRACLLRNRAFVYRATIVVEVVILTKGFLKRLYDVKFMYSPWRYVLENRDVNTRENFNRMILNDLTNQINKNRYVKGFTCVKGIASIPKFKFAILGLAQRLYK